MSTSSDIPPLEEQVSLTQTVLNETCLLLESKTEQLFQLDAEYKQLESDMMHMRTVIGTISRDLSSYAQEHDIQAPVSEVLNNYIKRLDTLSNQEEPATQEPTPQPCKIPELDIQGTPIHDDLNASNLDGYGGILSSTASPVEQVKAEIARSLPGLHTHNGGGRWPMYMGGDIYC